jgi:hypothetical protein
VGTGEARPQGAEGEAVVPYPTPLPPRRNLGVVKQAELDRALRFTLEIR